MQDPSAVESILADYVELFVEDHRNKTPMFAFGRAKCYETLANSKFQELYP